MYALTAAVLSVAAASASAQIMSTFDTDAEGWGTLNDARDFLHTSALGNQPGAIPANDRGTGAIWYYAASTDYLGDRTGNLGGSLSWDILGITGDQTSISARADVILSGAGMTIGINVGVQPVNDQWTSWSVMLQADGWRTVSDLSDGDLSATAVSHADFASVLADLDGLYIRGEYTNGSDATALDNVVLTIPAPGAWTVAGALLLAGRGRRRG